MVLISTVAIFSIFVMFAFLGIRANNEGDDTTAGFFGWVIIIMIGLMAFFSSRAIFPER